MSSKHPIFSIQQHHATHLHYDFRLEIGKVLTSWAVPKGLSLRYGVKRLAVMTEDHSMSYAKFEGEIPEGSYGAGHVVLWDYGYYENMKDLPEESVSMKKCLKDGKILIKLHGKRYKASFALIRTKNDNWIIFRVKDKA